MNKILTRSYTADLHVRDDGDGRTLHGALLPWGVEARVREGGRIVTEVFERGALADVKPELVPLTARHPTDAQQLPIGVTVSIEERADAAWGSWHVSKTALGDEVLELARDNVPLALSIGFMEVAGGSRWTHDRSRVTRTRAGLDHVAIVRKGAYVGAAVAAVRGLEVASPTPLLDLARRR
jgi:phage head maturation protease